MLGGVLQPHQVDRGHRLRRRYVAGAGHYDIRVAVVVAGCCPMSSSGRPEQLINAVDTVVPRPI
jgi:hypothetical protein